MSTFIYVNELTLEKMTAYAKGHFKEAETIIELSSLQVDWDKRNLNKVLTGAQKGDTIAVFDALSLACSFGQVLSFLNAALEKGVHVQFIKYELEFKAKPVNKLVHLLSLSRKIENDFVSQRNRDARAKRQVLGIKLGRPKVRKNAGFKLDKFKKDIAYYLTLSISKASIAKLINCHPQTLHDWIERNEISAEVETKVLQRTRVKKSELV